MATSNVLTLPLAGHGGDGKRAYDAATRRRGDYHWLTKDLSADAEILQAIPAIRQRARDLVRNNAYAARAVSILVANIVGDGIKPRPKTGSDAANRRVMAVWQEWADEIGFDGLQTLAVRAMIESGESLVRLYTRRRGSMMVPLMLRVLEGDYLDAGKVEVTAPQRIVGGIQYDPVDDVEGYWLFARHPGDRHGYTMQSSFVPATSVCHLYRIDRPGQTRGVSWLSPVIAMLRQVGDYQDAALMKAKVEACFVAAIENDGDSVAAPIGVSEDGETKQVLDLAGNVVERMAPGMILNLPAGQKLTAHSPGGQGDFEPFLLQLLYAVSAGIGLTFDQLTGDLRQANFSSLRAGKIEQRRLVEQWQYHLVVPRLCRPVWRRFIEAAIDAGALPMRAGGYPVEWIAPRHEPIDPAKETTAVLEQIQGGLLPPSWAATERGWSYDDVLEAYAEDKRKAEALGLQFAAMPAAADDTRSGEGDDAAGG